MSPSPARCAILFGDRTLPPRVREILILRTSWMWSAEYELIYSVGGYAMAALAINRFEIPIEPNLTGHPAK